MENAHLPSVFLERLRAVIPVQDRGPVLESFAFKRDISVRVNTLKVKIQDAAAQLLDKGIKALPVPWCAEAFVLSEVEARAISDDPLVREGKIYIQSLSSMLPAVILDPRPGENVLDLCAAPGSKTSQMAAMMKNEGWITAVEVVKERMYKLKNVLSLLGVRNVSIKLMDGRRFRQQGELFDKILVDAPCSSEGRFKTSDKKSFQYWSLRKIKEMVQKQRGLVLSAGRLLKPGGVLVYSTCTFAPEENEGVIDWLLRKSKERLEVLPVDVPGVQSYPAVQEWQGKTFSKEVQNCFKVLPNPTMEGFFVAKLIKVKRSNGQNAKSFTNTFDFLTFLTF